LNATFLFVLCNAPPQAGRDVQRSAAPAQIPESEGLQDVHVNVPHDCRIPAELIDLKQFGRRYYL
jgi:hypothetical protein